VTQLHEVGATSHTLRKATAMTVRVPSATCGPPGSCLAPSHQEMPVASIKASQTAVAGVRSPVVSLIR